MSRNFIKIKLFTGVVKTLELMFSTYISIDYQG